MVRFPRTVAMLVALILAGGPAAATTCEAACLFAAQAPGTSQVEAAPKPWFPCHEVAAASLRVGSSMSARIPHTVCGHDQATEPFVVAAKAIDRLGTVAAALAVASPVEPVQSRRVDGRPHAHTPPGASRSCVVPLRI